MGGSFVCCYCCIFIPYGVLSRVEYRNIEIFSDTISQSQSLAFVQSYQLENIQQKRQISGKYDCVLEKR